MKKLLTSVLIILVSNNVFGLDKPFHSSKDARIQYVKYTPNDVVLVNGAIGIATQIILETDEQILEMASGYSDGWEIVEKRNNIYLKPKREKANTNLVVSTSKRVYAFDLKSNNAKNPTYRLAFKYPDTQKKLGDEALQAQSVEFNLNKTINFIPKNKKYSMQPNKLATDILPIEAFDDGRFTYVKFKKNSDMPVVSKIGGDGQETLVNTHIQNNYLVIHGIYKTLVLRAGRAVVGLYNENYNGGDIDTTKTGTVSNNVHREIK